MRARSRPWAAACLAAAGLLGCASGPSFSPADEWRLVPESTVLGERRQFFLYGKGLDSAQVKAPYSVAVEKGWLKPDGRVLSLYLTVRRIHDDSTVFGEKPGARKLTIKTPDTSVALILKIVDENAR